MSGVLHPVGPEPARTYWIRRGILLAVVLLLALGVVIALASLTKAAVATVAPPAIAPPPANSPTAAESPSPVGTSVAPGPTSSIAAAPPATSSATSSAATPASPSTRPTAKPSPAATTIGTPDCRPSYLRVTIKGDKTLSPGQRNTFKLAMTNGDRQPCLASVTDENFELKVYSGKDRIWSSRDCSKVLDDFDKKLAAGASVGWTMRWNGERSVKGERCQKGAATPRAGTYWATAQLTGADPVQLRMIIG